VRSKENPSEKHVYAVLPFTITEKIMENPLGIHGVAMTTGMKEVKGIEAAIGYAKEIYPATLGDNDALVIGAPNHMGSPSRAIKKVC
jgi:multimeric flavodoxin WrbA